MSNTLPSPSLQSLTFNVTKGTPPNQVTFTQEITSASWGTNTIPLTNPNVVKTLKTNPEGTDPYISAEYGNDGLGNVISSVSTRTLDDDGYHCDCTSTAEDASATTAVAMVFNCMDFRLRENTTCNLNCRGYYNNYDEIIAAGVSLGYNGLSVPVQLQSNYSSSTFTGWSDYVDTHITLGNLLHNINEIIIVEHAQCGAYAAQYGSSETPTPQGKYPLNGRYLFPSDEQNLQLQNVQICGSALWSKFNGTNGTIRHINGLVIKGYITAVDGSSLTEIYYKDTH
jgi:hypothetical protein